MKIFLLGLVLVAVTEVISATKSDDGKKDGRENKNRSQLDMLLAQMKQQQDQIQRLQEVDKQQELKNEELQLQLREQRQENEEQRQEIKDQRQEIKELRHKSDKQEIKELTKIKRGQRSDNGTVEEMKKLIHDEVDPLIDGLRSQLSGLSQCEVGFYNITTLWSGGGTKTIFFERNFTQTPKVVTSVAMVNGDAWTTKGGHRGVVSVPQRPTTTQFDLYYYVSGMDFWGVSWIACA